MSWIGIGIVGTLGLGVYGATQKQKSQGPQLIDTQSPQQKAVSSKLAQILTQGGAAYTGDRVADQSANERYLTGNLRSAYDKSQMGIDRLLSGQFPEEYFNQAIADPTRQQFEEDVAPQIRENQTLTGNRFADRSAIEMGRARGDVEKGILQERGRFGLETYRDPLTTLQGLAQISPYAQEQFAQERAVQQAKLDAEFDEFLRTNPDSGGLISAMMQFGQQSPYMAFQPQQQQSALPGALSGMSSLLSAQIYANASKGNSGSYGSSSGSYGSSSNPYINNPFVTSATY
jgi:hypothetical protein